MIREDLETLNEILDRLTLNGFFVNYKELIEYYEYLAVTYHFDLKTQGVDPITGEIVPLKAIWSDKITR